MLQKTLHQLIFIIQKIEKVIENPKIQGASFSQEIEKLSIIS
jgi:hypothetical protein